MRSPTFLPAFSVAMVLMVAGCTQRVIPAKLGSVQAAFSTADVRVITTRPGPVIPDQTIVCTEPSPDAIRALSDKQGVTGAAPNGLKVGVDSSVAEAAAELNGRTTALLALRDGLFRACEAVANGFIGSEAYSLVLNRYGEAMVTLFLAEDAEPEAAAAKLASVMAGSAAATAGDCATPASKPTPPLPKNAAPAAAAPAAFEAPEDREPAIRQTVGPPDLRNLATLIATNVDPAKAVPRKPTPPKAATAPHPASTAHAQNGVSTAGGELERMQAAYLGLTTNAQENAHLAFILCVEEFDPTRKMPIDAGGKPILNPLLQAECGDYVHAVFAGLKAGIAAQSSGH